MTADTTTLDLGPQTRILARLADGVREDRLTDPTPCPDLAVRNLLGHLTGLAVAFRDAARKDLGPTTDTSPEASMPDIGPNWREELAAALAALAEAWREPDAWTGATRAGGIDPDAAAVRAAYGLLAAAADESDRGQGMFGPVVAVPADAPLLERALGLSGRDPGWSRTA
ncbi:TIGR03086 family metal-binding protein [Streptomyces sp. NPDC006349]|uniref:TIGR03086 family metal-binding protein n=1 Tax=Streptomyces sp. NPDC006349 TaxID=3156757 RepID=UPI0033B0D62A